VTDKDGTSSQLSFGNSTRRSTPTTSSPSTSTGSSGSSPRSTSSESESASWSNGLPSLTLVWVLTTHRQAMSLRRVLSDILRACRTRMWMAWDLSWTAQVDGQCLRLTLFALPEHEQRLTEGEQRVLEEL